MNEWGHQTMKGTGGSCGTHESECNSYSFGGERPEHRWEDKSKTNLKQLGWDVMKWTDLVQLGD